MRTAVLVLSTTLILSTNYGARAQQPGASVGAPQPGTSQPGASVGAYLVLTKGDAPSGSTPSCSFVSATELAPVPIVQGLLTVQPGDSPDVVGGKIGFPPDQSYSHSVLQWTAVKGGNYIKAVVNFRNQQANKRYFTMAINHKQPNEKQCQWEANSGYR